MTKKTRAAVTVFIEADREMSEVEAAMFFSRALHAAAGENINAELPSLGETNFRIVNTMEAGLAAGNGYLWTGITAKTYKERGL